MMQAFFGAGISFASPPLRASRRSGGGVEQAERVETEGASFLLTAPSVSDTGSSSLALPPPPLRKGGESYKVVSSLIRFIIMAMIRDYTARIEPDCGDSGSVR